tara:strand:- start:314 stop:1372 length:1059 start_codon:yes stop_codon:yes gene_type:complete
VDYIKKILGMVRLVFFGILFATVSKAQLKIPDIEDPAVGLPSIKIPNKSLFNNTVTKLGEKLFFDPFLSVNGSISCATCHVPDQGFTQNGQRLSSGVEGKIGHRNSPTLLNIAFAQSMFVDGRVATLEEQAWQPILAHDEMGNSSVSDVLQKLKQKRGYVELFTESFGDDGISESNLAIALSAFQRTLVSGNSAYDKWYYEGQDDAMNEPARRGYQLFAGQAQCWQCHSIAGPGVLFSDNQFHNTGVSYRSKILGLPEDLGRYVATKLEYEKRAFKTPTLRNVAETSPYMHDGSLSTLKKVVQFYNEGGSKDPLLSPIMGSLNLSDRDIDDLVEFLRALSGDQNYEHPKIKG